MAVGCAANKAKAPNRPGPEDVADLFVQSLAEGKAMRSARMFSQPEILSKPFQELNTKNLATALKVVLQHLGEPGDLERNSGLLPTIVYYTLMSGNVAYWLGYHGPSYRVVYTAKFPRAGSGFLMVELCKPSFDWEVMDFAVALPVENSSSVQKIKAIIHDIEAKIKKFKMPNELPPEMRL